MVPWRMSSIGLLCVLGLLVCICGPLGCLGQGRGQQGQGRGGQVRGQAGQEEQEEEDLRERDVLCHEGGCYVVHFQRKTFRESWRSCKEKGGNLATVRNEEEAGVVHKLLSSVEGRGPRTRLRLWIGLQRQPRQCSSTRPLRGFTWVTGEQESDYTNWLRPDPPGSCAAPRCVAFSVNTAEAVREQHDNFRWLDGACALPVDGFLCQHSYRGMCPPLDGEGGGPAIYTTPFGLVTPLLTHLPYGSIGALTCPADSPSPADQSVLCMEREDGTVGWSRDAPLCSTGPQDLCEEDNGGCEHYCENTDTHFYCQCSDGFTLGEDGTSCHSDPTPDPDPTTNPTPAQQPCSNVGCEFDCEETPRGFRCTCPHGYLLGRDGRSCVDVDECQQQPCPQICVNAPGTFECRCRQGYEQDQDGECVCQPGYEPNQEGECVDVDECHSSTTCQQMCLNYMGGFECYCKAGYELQSDQYSCRLRPEDYDSSTVPSTPLTPNINPGYDPDRSLGHDPNSLEWQTDPPSVDHISWSTAQTPQVHYEQITMPGAGAGDGAAGTVAGTGYDAGTEAETGVETKAGAGASASGEAKAGAGHKENSGKKKHDKSWLLVALLVPLCVFIVVMLALGIVYCTSCAVDQNQSLTDCYRWALPASPAENRTFKTGA